MNVAYDSVQPSTRGWITCGKRQFLIFEVPTYLLLTTTLTFVGMFFGYYAAYRSAPQDEKYNEGALRACVGDCGDTHVDQFPGTVTGQ